MLLQRTLRSPRSYFNCIPAFSSTFQLTAASALVSARRSASATSCLRISQRRLHGVASGLREFSSASPEIDRGSLRVAIVGSGPSAFYAAKYILKEHPDVKVDMIEALCTPYGLVRFGVAPDHPEVKSVQNDFANVATDPRYRFFGNVRLGADVSVATLQSMYHAVILAYGAASERSLGIEGETLEGVHSARTFVNWYNGHPDCADMDFGLDKCGDTAVVIGQGNVAMDVARILVSPISLLAKTDISEHALEKLRASQVKRVLLVGRRGPAQAAFTIKEFREFTRLPGCETVVTEEELARGANQASKEELETKRAAKRKWDLMAKLASGELAPEPALPGDATKAVEFRFFLSPLRVVSAEGRGHVGACVLERTRLEGEANEQKARGTGEEVSIPCGLLLTSVGYRSLPVDGVPFDDRRAVVPTDQGRVPDQTGLYVAGWLKRGPTGIIGTNIGDAKETVKAVLEDWDANTLIAKEDPADLRDILRARGVKVVDQQGWLKIDKVETEQGAAVGKPREKLVRLEQLLVAAGVV